jgi:16S rRNA (guanine966-N2)-methyltransferase
LCRLLNAGWLVDRAFVYLEMDRRQAIPGLPGGWEIHREATAGDVRYGLARSAGAA